MDETVFGISIYGNQLKLFFLLLNLESPNIELLGEPVDESIDPPDRDNEERPDEETPKEDLFNENQGQEEANELSSPLDEDQ